MSDVEAVVVDAKAGAGAGHVTSEAATRFPAGSTSGATTTQGAGKAAKDATKPVPFLALWKFATGGEVVVLLIATLG
jgi:hypothetical protein